MLKVLPAPLAGCQPTLTRVLMTSSGVVLAMYICGSASPPEGRGSDPADTHKVRHYTLYLVFKEPTAPQSSSARGIRLWGTFQYY